MLDLKEKINAATIVPNARRADIAHRAYMEYQSSGQDSNNSDYGAEEPDLSHYDVPETQRLAAQQAETEDNIVPRRLWLYLLRRQGVEQLKWCQLSAQTMQRLAEEVTKGVYRVEGRGLYRDEFVTCGGVNLKEVSLSCFFCYAIDWSVLGTIQLCLAAIVDVRMWYCYAVDFAGAFRHDGESRTDGPVSGRGSARRRRSHRRVQLPVCLDHRTHRRQPVRPQPTASLVSYITYESNVGTDIVKLTMCGDICVLRSYSDFTTAAVS